MNHDHLREATAEMHAMADDIPDFVPEDLKARLRQMHEQALEIEAAIDAVEAAQAAEALTKETT